MFQPGQSILIRTVVGERVRFAEPARSVIDDGESIAFCRAAGTPMKVPTVATLPRSDPDRDARSRQEYESGQWGHHDAEWTDTNVLVCGQPGTWWSGWLLWDAVTFEFRCWYVNFETPLVRSRFGFDTKDLSLDLIVLPTGEVLEKDRGDYDERVRTGLITAHEADQVRRADLEAREAIAQGAPPFNKGWIAWRPDPDWPIADLPPDWDRV